MITPNFDLIAEHGYWGEHDTFPVSDWQYEVSNGSTRSSYWEWVAVKIEWVQVRRMSASKASKTPSFSLTKASALQLNWSDLL